MDIVGLALEFIAAYGLIAIFVLLVMDGALMLPVFPGELVLIMAVAAHADDMAGLLFIIALTSAAGLLGSIILYGITRGGGRRLVERFPRFFMMPRRRRERLERTFQKPVGQSLVLFLRLLPLTRVLVNIPAGLAKMPFVRFVVLSTIGLVTYHAAFLWFTYEARREGSPIASQKEQLQDAYGSPAMAFVEANAIITGAVLVALGVILSVRASAKMWRDPEESTGSIVGSLATAVLFWGGIALGVFTYMQPETVFLLIDWGGLDIDAIAAQLGYSATEVLLATAAVAVMVGFVLHRLNRAATVRRKVHMAQQKARTKAEVEALARAALARQASTRSTGRQAPEAQRLARDTERAPRRAAEPDAGRAPEDAGWIPEGDAGDDRRDGAAEAGGWTPEGAGEDRTRQGSSEHATDEGRAVGGVDEAREADERARGIGRARGSDRDGAPGRRGDPKRPRDEDGPDDGDAPRDEDGPEPRR